MKDNDIDTSRRRATGIILAASAALPLVALTRPRTARAADMPHLTANDPTAKALHYTDDASTADRPAKMGVPGDKQHCQICNFLKGSDGAEWRPCQIFPGKLVNIHGWCMSWTPKA
jgi:hypothetical protein